MIKGIDVLDPHRFKEVPRGTCRNILVLLRCIYKYRFRYSDRQNGLQMQSVCQTVRHHWHNGKL